MPRYSEINQYPGINAHLNCFLQQEGGGWETFHTEYLVAVARALDVVLPKNYYAVSEKSLQIVENRFDFGLQQRQFRTRPDVTVYQVGKLQAETSPSADIVGVAVPTRTIALADVLEEEPDKTVYVTIYEVEPGKVPGRPVTRIEMLSPVNKPPNSYHRQYMARRAMILESGVNLVEIDFFHQTEPVSPVIASYPKHEPDSYPYAIMVTNPHPHYMEGHIDLYGIRIDDKLPTIAIPLSGEQTVPLDFGAVYNQVFQAVRVLSIVVDYETEPVNFMTYTLEDRNRLRPLLNKILAALP